MVDWQKDLHTKLLGTGAFFEADASDSRITTPIVPQMIHYSVVLVSASGDGWANAVSLGDNLATYYDGGGRVVLTWSSNATNDWRALRGRFGTTNQGYTLIESGAWQEGQPGSLGVVEEPQSPL